ncbi:hypothetical protein [Streptomyces sp. NPDC091217]|uniref:hypothetical protein n=1 Tax=Streptomyces sp. NPDC091217 TaxID=3365975 RepID=UPI00380050E1
MAPRASWRYDTDERIGLGRFSDYRAIMPTAAQSLLTVERHGHTIVVDGQGLLIDGRRVSSRPLTMTEAKAVTDPYISPAFQVTDGGAVVFHGRIVAALKRGTEPRIYGPDGPCWARGAGHTIVVDRHAIYVDGQCVRSQPMPLAPPGSRPLWIATDGRVFYGETEIARVYPDKEAAQTTFPTTPAPAAKQPPARKPRRTTRKTAESGPPALFSTDNEAS